MNTRDDNRYYLKGVTVPETPEPGKDPEPWSKTAVVGTSLPRVDGSQKVTGEAVYPSDIRLPGMLYGAILGCPHPHADVKSVDTTEAEKMPGVRAILTASSPGANVPWIYPGGQVKVTAKLFDQRCRFEGDQVAAVVADTPYQAWDAAHSIKVEYKILPFVADERQALEKGAPLIHGKDNRVGEPKKYERGDVDKGFAEADIVLESEYRTETELHTPLELHGCTAHWDGDSLTLWESTQGVYVVQETVATALNLPLSKVRVIGHYMGGGFGSKLETGKYSVTAALLARMTGKPVKLFLTREETFLITGNRPACNMKLKAGVKKDGTLTALQFSALGSGGAHAVDGMALVDWLIQDLYTCPNVRTECTDVYVNAGPARPFRAPGHPQGAWALEQMMDALAEALNMDPVELRLKNIPSYSQARKGNPPYTSTGLKECLVEGAKAFGWEKARKRKSEQSEKSDIRTGVGMAGCVWVVGGGKPPATVRVKLLPDGSAGLNMGASDIGTGTKTIMAMVVAEELGLKPDKIQVENADTGTTEYAQASGGSKTVPTEAPAVRAAAIHVKQQLLKMAADELKTKASALSIKEGEIVIKNDPSRKIKISKLAGWKECRAIVGEGRRGPNPENKVVCPFGAQFCEVSVNVKTGEVDVVRFVAAHDSGRVMNRLTYDSQVIGGITMGVGLAMTEARVLDRNETGKLCNRNWHDYKLPTALDVPADIATVPIEPGDTECNITGAKGLGEPATIPTAPAIANAVYNAVGIRVTHTPINPVRLSELFEERRLKKTAQRSMGNNIDPNFEITGKS